MEVGTGYAATTHTHLLWLGSVAANVWFYLQGIHRKAVEEPNSTMMSSLLLIHL